MVEEGTKVQEYKNIKFQIFTFEGNAKEYFRIWIVNIALSILTLGIYSAWAKVRTNRYMYANTFLNGSNFEYNANPIRILIGRVIVVGFYALFLLFSQYLYKFEIAIAIAVFAFLAMPWLVKQAVSFKLRNTSYRHVPFRYTGKTRDFYLFFIFHGLLNLFTLFLAFPFSYIRFKELILDDAYYGQGRFAFKGKVQNVYEIYFSILGWSLMFLMILLLLFLLLAGLYGINVGGEEILVSGILEEESLNEFNSEQISLVTSSLFLVFYIPFMFGQKGLNDAYFSNYVRNNATLHKASFRGNLNIFKMAWISVSNIVAILFSLGLLYPWARIRYFKYKLEQTSFACSDYNQFESHGYEQGLTVGEEMMDFFDIDIGL